jgi:hypothetical protein
MPGLAHFAGELMKEGTASRTAKQVAEEACRSPKLHPARKMPAPNYQASVMRGAWLRDESLSATSGIRHVPDTLRLSALENGPILPFGKRLRRSIVAVMRAVKPPMRHDATAIR